VEQGILASWLATIWLVTAGTFEPIDLVAAAAVAMAATWVSSVLERARRAPVRAPTRWLLRFTPK
jgi:multisubunit Na+/H+ antiporter MnhE subunit